MIPFDEMIEECCVRILDALKAGPASAAALKKKVDEGGAVDYLTFYSSVKMLDEAGFIQLVKPVGGSTLKWKSWERIGE